jgi:TM2 domain-containing membrane protein YozV
MGFLRNKDHRVFKDTYVLLTLFWGWMGLHKFYAGKKFIGFIYLIFSWTLIPAFISFFEFIIAILKNKDFYGKIKA